MYFDPQYQLDIREIHQPLLRGVKWTGHQKENEREKDLKQYGIKTVEDEQ